MQDVCIAEPVGLVEEQQDDHLVRAHVELVPLLPKGRPHVCAAGGSSAAAGGTISTLYSSGVAAAQTLTRHRTCICRAGRPKREDTSTDSASQCRHRTAHAGMWLTRLADLGVCSGATRSRA